MNHSLVTADRTTHLKIVAVSLAAAIAVILVGITARVTDTATASANLQAHGPVVKAGKPAAITAREGNTVQ
jgi:cytochrome oxidase Cu insertion factor (SCO1/SenC/PrrC family)